MSGKTWNWPVKSRYYVGKIPKTIYQFSKVKCQNLGVTTDVVVKLYVLSTVILWAVSSNANCCHRKLLLIVHSVCTCDSRLPNCKAPALIQIRQRPAPVLWLCRLSINTLSYYIMCHSFKHLPLWFLHAVVIESIIRQFRFELLETHKSKIKPKIYFQFAFWQPEHSLLSEYSNCFIAKWII